MSRGEGALFMILVLGLIWVSLPIAMATVLVLWVIVKLRQVG